MIDLETLLKPISDDSPSGPDLRLDHESDTFTRAQEQRKQLDAALDPDGKGKEPDWPAVSKTCEEALLEQTKDLELAGWLTEAQLELEGIGGLAQGLELMRRLLENFWGDLHPGFDEDGITLPIRGRPVSWLGSSGFLRAVRGVPLAPGAGVDTSWENRGRAAALSDHTLSEDRRAELAADGQSTLEEWEAGLSSTPIEALRTQYEHLTRAMAELKAIDAFCTERFEDEEPPSFYPLEKRLDEVIELLVAKGAGPMTETETETETAPSEEPTQSGEASQQPSGPIAGRQRLLRWARIGTLCMLPCP